VSKLIIDQEVPNTSKYTSWPAMVAEKQPTFKTNYNEIETHSIKVTLIRHSSTAEGENLEEL
jgi:hypothetical protein